MKTLFNSWVDQRYTLDGVQCLVMTRGDGLINGYVGIDHEHPWYEKEHTDIDVDVHGGLTFSGVKHQALGDTGMLNPLWWLGFDTAHAGDVNWGTRIKETLAPVYNKDEDYVRDEIALLVALVKAARKQP